MNENNGRWVVCVSRTKFIALVILIVVVGLVWLVLNVLTPTMGISDYYAPTTGVTLPSSDRSKQGVSNSVESNYYPSYQQNPSITDTREFMKTRYDATIRTRDVSGVVKDVTNIVKGADGRVDGSSSSDTSGYVTFVVAKTKFEAMRAQVEKLAYGKLYVESISSQNLLGQKQNIEQQANNITDTLVSLNTQRDALTTKHNVTISTINSEITRIATELARVRTNMANTDDQQTYTSLKQQETSLINQDATQRQKLSSENSSYAISKQSLDNSISNYNSNLTNVAKQDTQFTNNIETVNGYVNVAWVSYWQIATIFSPISPWIIVIVLAIVAWFYLKRVGYLPSVEWK